MYAGIRDIDSSTVAESFTDPMVRIGHEEGSNSCRSSSEGIHSWLAAISRATSAATTALARAYVGS